jgi:hypothetical protein
VSKALQKYIDRYGAEAGPKLFHILKSRAGHKGVRTRLRHQIEHLTGRPHHVRRKPEAPGQLTLPLAEPIAVGADLPA